MPPRILPYSSSRPIPWTLRTGTMFSPWICPITPFSRSPLSHGRDVRFAANARAEVEMILALIELLWAAMILLFLAGAVAYAFDSHVGVALLKRSLVLLVVLLVGPSLIATVFG